MSVTAIASTIRKYISTYENQNEEDTVFRYVRVNNNETNNVSKLENALRYKCSSIPKEECLQYYNSVQKGDDEPKLKLTLMGEEGVGKSSICGRICMGDEYDDWLDDQYDTDTAAMAIDTIPKIKIGNQTIIFDLDNIPYYDEWDKGDNLLCEEKDIFVLCFSLRSKDSFKSIFNILKNIMSVRNITKDTPNSELDFAVILCGTKADDEFCFEDDEPRHIEIENIMDIISLFQFPYLETSSMSNKNIQYLFDLCFYELWTQTKTNIIDIPRMIDTIEKVNNIL
jgi:GTPase SAR1 family protein